MSDEIVPATSRRSARLSSVRQSNHQYEAPTDSLDTADPSKDIGSDDGGDDINMNEANLKPTEQDTTHDDDAQEDWVVHSRLRPPKYASQPASTSLGRPIIKRRTYKFIKRVCRPRKTSKMRTEWLEILQQTDEELRRLVCCASRKCFTVQNLSFLREKMLQYLNASLSDRKRALASMATSDGEFVFDGHIVCGQFLRKAFRFSLEVQASARRIPSTGTNGLSPDVISSLHSMTSERTRSSSSCRQSSDSEGGSSHSLSMDSVLTFIDRIVDDTADRMPDNGELHLPFFRKEEVYNIFKLEFKKLYPSREVPSQSYFLSTWKKNRFKVKVRQDTRFTKCTTCERLRSAKADAIRRGLPTDHIKKEQSEHNDFIAMERREYVRKAELAMLRPSKFLSIVVDGADQSAYSLPHFVTKVKDGRGQGLKVHLIGVLQHLSLNHLRLYTMTDDHQTGANHIVECVHRFINDAARDGPLPKTLFVQLDNCVRENKNQYLLSYLEALIRWYVFDCVEIGFLPIGHTHCDVDQAFSSTSERLKYHDAITLPDLQHIVSSCYNDKTTVSSLKQVVNWSGLCDATRCNNNINLITQYRYFRFNRSKTVDGKGNVSSVCYVRSSCTEDWRPLESDNKPGITSILKFVPNLSQTPPEKVECPQGLEEFENRIDSERSRIVSEVKMRSLTSLKKEVFRAKTLAFHWNLSSVIETSSSRQSDTKDTELEDSRTHDTHASSSSDYTYDIGSFVAVNTGISGQGQGFWIGKIIDISRGRCRKIMSVSVHWYESYGSTNVYIGRYRPNYREGKHDSKKNNPWTDNISTSTILVSFPRLTSDKRLPAAVSTHLREHFSSKLTQNERTNHQ